MVDGIRMTFSKEKMIARLTKEGRAGEITEEDMEIMDNLDGQEVSSANWSRMVWDEPFYSCTGKDGKTYDVFEDDCIGN